MERGVGEGEDSWWERAARWRPGRSHQAAPGRSVSPCGPGNRLKVYRTLAPAD